MKPLPPQAPHHFSPRPPKSKPGSGNKNIIFAVLLLAVVGLGVFGWLQYQSNQELKAKAALAEKAAQDAAAKAKQLAENPPSLPDVPTDGTQRGAAAIGNFLNNPQARQAIDAFAGNAIDNLYAGLFQQLNLDADQTAALRALILKRSSAATDAFAAAAQGGDLSNIRQSVADAQAGVDQQIQSMLGANGYQQYQSYTQNLRGNFGGFGGAQGPGGFPAPGGFQGPGN